VASVKLARPTYFLQGDPKHIKYDREVTKLPQIEKPLLIWFWHEFGKPVNRESLSDTEVDNLLKLIASGYVCRKDKGLYAPTELGQIYYDKLTAKQNSLRLGIPAETKPLCTAMNHYIKNDWFIGTYLPTKTYVTDARVLVKAKKIFSFPYFRATTTNLKLKPCDKNIETTINCQIDDLAARLKESPIISPYKFQRLDMFTTGRVWFQNEETKKVYAMSEAYFDYLYAYSGIIILEDVVRLVTLNDMPIFVFQSNRDTNKQTFPNKIIAYVAGLRVKEVVE
jgi:hypothetical protein